MTKRAHRIVDEVVENMPFANIRRLAATSRRLRRHAVSGCSAASSRDSLIWPQPGVNRPTSPPVVIAGSALRVGAAGASLMQWPRHSSLVSSAGSLPARRVASLLANRHHCFQHTTGPQSVASRRQRCQSEDLDLPAGARKLERQPARRVLGGSDQDAGKRTRATTASSGSRRGRTWTRSIAL